VQINTEGGCHLEAHLVRKALGALPLGEVDLLFVENVGNLVCPAEFDLGEDFKVAVSSVPEGDDKPLKYPHLFHLVRAVILTKMDLAPYVRFSPERFWGDVENLNPSARRFLVDSIQGDGLEEWLSGSTNGLRRNGADDRKKCAYPAQPGRISENTLNPRQEEAVRLLRRSSPRARRRRERQDEGAHVEDCASCLSRGSSGTHSRRDVHQQGRRGDARPVASLLGEGSGVRGSRSLQIGTFHAFGLRFLLRSETFWRKEASDGTL
jgi:hypothetical protein